MRRDDDSVLLNEQQARNADDGVKGMIPWGVPFLDYVISALADAGIQDVVLVVGPEHQGIRDYFQRTAPPARVHITFAEQAQPLGTANAVVAAAAVVGNQSFIVLNADNLYPTAAFTALMACDEAAVVAFERNTLVTEGNIDEARVQSFAALDIAEDNRLLGIIEKPDSSVGQRANDTQWVGMNLWLVTPALVDACRRVSRSTRGEFELPEAVALALNENVVVHAVKMRAPVLDLSRRSDIAVVAQRLSAVVARP